MLKFVVLAANPGDSLKKYIALLPGELEEKTASTSGRLTIWATSRANRLKTSRAWASAPRFFRLPEMTAAPLFTSWAIIRTSMASTAMATRSSRMVKALNTEPLKTEHSLGRLMIGERFMSVPVEGRPCLHGTRVF